MRAEDDGISGRGSGEPSFPPLTDEVATVEIKEDERICPICSGSGEYPWGPVGRNFCWKCGGDGVLLREVDEYLDLFEKEEWL